MCLASCVPKEKNQAKSSIEVITYQYKKSDNKKTNYLEKQDSLNLCSQ
ncbi:MAG: hypothetical protein RL308_2812 [Bacteroidota bacterium]